MNIHKIFILFLLLVGVFSSCQEKEFRIPITLESFADMADVKYRVDADLLNESLRHVVLADTDRETPDIQARRHYLDGGQLVWVTRNGISSKADTLLLAGTNLWTETVQQFLKYFHGTNIILIHDGHHFADKDADIFLSGKCSEILPETAKELERLKELEKTEAAEAEDMEKGAAAEEAMRPGRKAER